MLEFVAYLSVLMFLVTLLHAEVMTIKDPVRMLLWEDTVYVEEEKVNYTQALAYCDGLTLDGYNDWRVPTLEELLTLVDYKRYKPAILSDFDHVDEEILYWSSTPYIRSKDEQWGVLFKDGSTSNASINYDRYVRCVKTIETSE